MGRRFGVAAAALCCAVIVLLAGPGARAEAADIACGDTITEDVVLSADLSCTGTALRIGADGVDLDLAGHVVESVCEEADCSASIGIDNEGFDRVRIFNGTVRGVQSAIRLTGADRNEIAGVVAAGGGFERFGSNAVELRASDRNTLVRSDLLGGDPALLITASDRNRIATSSIQGGVTMRTGDGVLIEEGASHNTLRDVEVGARWQGVVIAASDHNVIASSLVRGFTDAISLRDGRGTRIAGNELRPGQLRAIDATGVSRSEIVRNEGSPISLSGNRNLVARNVVTSTEFVDVPLTIAGGDRNVVRGNEASFGLANAEILVAAGASRTLLEENVATGSRNDPSFTDADGIRVEAPGTIIRRNVAVDNSDLGIDAVAGVIDGGGNRASGNGNPLQCVNVACTP